jgi:WhiB family redox-sensing transcriptional regulator
MDWRHRAACRDEDPELFHPVGSSGPALLQIAEAKTVCRRCPVVSLCLTEALGMKDCSGVWGGMSEDERDALKRRQARTRQRSHVVEEPPEEPEQATPVRVDGRLMAAPATVLGRLYQERTSDQRQHALMSNGRSACGSTRLDTDRQRPVAELGASRRCRTKACTRLFTVADQEHLVFSHG